MFRWLSEWWWGENQEETSNTPSSPNKSVEEMENTIQLLEKRERLLQKKCQDEIEKAKKFLQQKNRNAAAICLKKKKQYEIQIQRIHAQISNLNTIINKLHESILDMEVLEAQKAGANALKSINKQEYDLLFYFCVILF